MLSVTLRVFQGIFFDRLFLELLELVNGTLRKQRGFIDESGKGIPGETFGRHPEDVLV